MTYLSKSNNRILPDNSSSSILSNGSTFTGVAVDVSGYSALTTAVLTDQSGVMYAEFSPDGVNWDSSLSYKVAADSNDVHRLTVTRQYFRVRFTNDSGSDQTYFRLQCAAGDHHALSSPLNLGIQQDADAIVARVIDSELDIVSGKLQGYAVRNKFGKNTDIDTTSTPEDVWETGGVYTGFPTGSAETLAVLSSDANDTSAGTGARSVTFFGLDADYNDVSETIILNGTTPVTSVSTVMRVHSAYVSDAGSGEFNAGTITLRHSSTTANVFLNIQPARNQSNCAAYTIPAGKTGYVRRVHASIRGSNSANIDGALWIRTFGNPPRLRRPFSFTKTDRLNDLVYGGLRLGEKTDIIMRINTTTANNVAVTGGYDIIVVDN